MQTHGFKGRILSSPSILGGGIRTGKSHFLVLALATSVAFLISSVKRKSQSPFCVVVLGVLVAMNELFYKARIVPVLRLGGSERNLISKVDICGFCAIEEATVPGLFMPDNAPNGRCD